MNQKELDILIISDNGLETVGGEQESTKIIINGIKDKYSIGVIQPGYINTSIQGAYIYNMSKETRLKHLVKKPIHFLKYLYKMGKAINDGNPKVIHTQAQVSFFIVALLKKLKLIPSHNHFIHTERGLFTKYNRIFKWIFLFLMKELNTLVTTTKYNMKHWSEAIDKKKYSIEYKIIENTAGELFETVDKSKFVDNEDKKIRIGFAGRYTEWKNWPLAVEISEKLNERLGEKLEVKMAVGCLDKKSLEQTNDMFNRLKNTIGDRFKGEINITLKEMDYFYYNIDFFILTSNENTESFGRTLVEAMSRSTVVLTTNAGGSVEVVGNSNNVLNTAEEFANKILEFYYDEHLINKEKKNNLTRVKKVYSLQNNLNKHLNMYSKILK